MAEQLAVEVDVKNVTQQYRAAAVQSSRTSPFILFGYTGIININIICIFFYFFIKFTVIIVYYSLLQLITVNINSCKSLPEVYISY